MNKFILLTTATALCCVLTACRSHKSLTETVRSDSTRTEYRERVSYLPDTVPYKLQPQEAERITPDSASHLETDYAVSDVSVSTDGLLHHTLKTKPTIIDVPTLQKQTTRDSIVYRDRIITQTKTVTEEKELTVWQKTQIYALWGLIIVVVISYTIKYLSAKIRRLREK